MGPAGLVTMPEVPHPIPYRTRSLSPPGPMVLPLKRRESRSLPGLPDPFRSMLPRQWLRPPEKPRPRAGAFLRSWGRSASRVTVEGHRRRHWQGRSREQYASQLRHGCSQAFCPSQSAGQCHRRHCGAGLAASCVAREVSSRVPKPLRSDQANRCAVPRCVLRSCPRKGGWVRICCLWTRKRRSAPLLRRS
jgi:hypothetical protein